MQVVHKIGGGRKTIRKAAQGNAATQQRREEAHAWRTMLQKGGARANQEGGPAAQQLEVEAVGEVGVQDDRVVDGQAH